MRDVVAILAIAIGVAGVVRPWRPMTRRSSSSRVVLVVGGFAVGVRSALRST